MHTIVVRLKENPYNIAVGYNILRYLGPYLTRLNIGDCAYIITNKLIKDKYGAKLSKILKGSNFYLKFKTIPDTEKSKSLRIASRIIEDIADYERQRRIFIVAFGGGVVGDLSGFVASIYKRGVAYIQLPTTILAQVDSAIGGKTAVDLAVGKNLAGAFYQPRLTFTDIKLLESLSLRQVRCGLSEVIKYAIIKDARLFSFLENRLKDILCLKPDALEHIVRRSSEIKARIVETDEREKKRIRTVLNFGHTIGHAIETAAGYRLYNHGEAISLGMLAASDISKKLNLINEDAFNRIERLISAAGLPLRIKNTSFKKIMDAFYRDKKFIGKKNRLVLIEAIGRAKLAENVPLKVIKEAIKKRF